MKLWAGRFQKETDTLVNDFKSSITFDARMYKEDIAGSIAHAAMLGRQGIIEEHEAEKIIDGLKAILADIEDDKVEFYGTATSYNGTTFGGTAQVNVYGNIMSLVSADFADNKALTEDNAFAYLFKNYTTLKDASALLLPATTLTTYCYGSMFMGCSNLTAAPKLPATTLATDCYWRLFKDCTSLKEAYVKAAYDSGSCNSMFFGCSAADATLHTTSDNKASWTGNVPENWTIDDGWTD